MRVLLSFCLFFSLSLAAAENDYGTDPAKPLEKFPEKFPEKLPEKLPEKFPEKPIKADKAFVLTGEQIDENTYFLRWQIADNYYLYQKKFAVRDSGSGSDSDMPVSLELSDNHVPHADIFLGEGNVYYQFTDAYLKLTRPPQNLIITYQGCWEGGICYPVQHKRLVVGTPLSFVSVETEDRDTQPTDRASPATQGYNYYAQQIRRAAPVWVLLLFFLAGIGLTFTPCVLPMLPIVSGIITNDPGNRPSHRTRLALVYMLSMASVFSVFGLLSGWIGYGLRQAMASPPVLIFLALLISLLGASLIKPVGFLMRLPGSLALTQKANSVLNMTAGTYTGAALWGALSPLVVGTCLSAPLAAALIYLAEQGNPLFGAASLFFLALGMGIPLLLFALGFGYVMPKSGPWLAKIKNLFALLLFALAVFILSPLLPTAVEIALYSFFALTAICLFLLPLRPTLVAACFLAILTGFGYHFFPKDAPLSKFTEVSDYATFKDKLQEFGKSGKPTLVYYSAEWCITCKELEWNVFGGIGDNEQLAEDLNALNLLKADVTKNNADSRQLLAHFDVLGPPSIYFIDKQGRYRPEMTLVGNFSPKTLKTLLQDL